MADRLGTGTVADDDEPPPAPEPPPPPPTEPPPPPPEEPPAPPPPPGEGPPEEPPAEEPPAEEPPAELPPAEEPANAAPDCSGVAPSTRRLWPPNHKFRLVTLHGATDADNDSLTLEITALTQDEPVARHGRYRGPDARRKERANRRRASRRARRQRERPCPPARVHRQRRPRRGVFGTALAGVPHDKKHRWLDSGVSFDSFGG